MHEIEIFVAGLNSMGFVLAGVFFFRFWSRTREKLFGIFGISFLLLAANEVLRIAIGLPEEQLFWAYLLRVIAFSLLITAITAKNLERRRSEFPIQTPSD
jgi:hypothetical protein